jgi:hypothetical protein
MNRWSAALAIAVSLLAAGCGDDTPTAPSATQPKFTATLSGNNENPPISNAEAGGTGTSSITFNTTVVGGQVTAATADFTVTISNLPAGTPINLSHIHEGAASVNGSVRVNLALVAGEVTVGATRTVTFTKNGITVDPALAQAIMNNPAGYYFNSHSTLNGGGVVRGQLVRTQ